MTRRAAVRKGISGSWLVTTYEIDHRLRLVSDVISRRFPTNAEALAYAIREVGLASCECWPLPGLHWFSPDCPQHGYTDTARWAEEEGADQ